MDPKKDAKKDAKKGEPSPEDEITLELKRLEADNMDRGVDLAFTQTRLAQVRESHEHLVQDLDALRIKNAKAVNDYKHILQHRDGQIKATEARMGALTAENETLSTNIEERDKRIQIQNETLTAYESKLAEARTVLSDKEQLEEHVLKQLELINRQAEELSSVKETLEERDVALAATQAENASLQLKASATKEHCIIFDEAWIVDITRHKLKGTIPSDREGHLFLAMPELSISRGIASLQPGKLYQQQMKGKSHLDDGIILLGLYFGKIPHLAHITKSYSSLTGKLLLIGGQCSRESVEKEVSYLDLSSMSWEHPVSAQMQWQTVQASCTTMSQSKVFVQGGYRDQSLTAAMAILNTDQWRWLQPKVQDRDAIQGRVGHSITAVRSKIFLFGGLTESGLTDELWIFDLDTLSWTEIPTFGVIPCARKGASLVASEDGRKVYLFGGSSTSSILNDVHVLDVDHFSWSVVGTVGSQPQPRENAAVSCPAPYLIVSGLLPHTSTEQAIFHWKRRSSWEKVDSGSWASGIYWLKPNGTYIAALDEQIFILKPSREESLNELQVITLIMPERLEAMRGLKQKDEVIESLELLPNPEVSPASIEIAWRPPTKNADQIERYKLMMSSSTGVVREVVQGKMLRYIVTSLHPSTEYVFCVKAIYTDGSYLWSESQAFRTSAPSKR